MKTIKRICMTLIIMMLSATMVFGTLGFTASALSATSNEVFANRVNIVSRVKYGDTFEVPAAESDVSVKVTAPNGTVSESVSSVKADQVGTYTVSYYSTYGGKDYSYDFDVYCYVDGEYSIYVEYGGADIPTIAPKLTEGKDTEVKLPKAWLVRYNASGDMIKAEDDGLDAKVMVKTTLPDDVAQEANSTSGAKITLAKTGMVYVTYYAVLGESGKKVYSEDFQIKVQDSFTDASAPQVSVRGVPKDATLNRKVNLPVGEGTDKDDENVKVTVEVTDPSGNPVKTVDVDENGYAYREDGKTYDEIEFDNNKIMSFYPVEKGTYVIKYTAIDDADKTSNVHSYNLTVSDTTPPVFEKLDDYMIPASWGLSVKGKSGTRGDHLVQFPIPELTDNCGSEGLEVRFELTDPAGKSVIDISNILADTVNVTGDSSKYGANGETYDFKTKFFDFNSVKTSDTLTGDYKVQYTAKDKNNNRSYKTFTINVVDEFTDDADPVSVKIVDAPEHILISREDGTFEVPAVETTDRGDSRPYVEYKLTSAADAGKELSVSGGEILDVKADGAETYIVNDKDEKIKIEGGQVVTLTLTVTDKLGNSKSDNVVIDVFSYKMSNSFNLVTTGIKYDNGGKAFDEAPDNSFVTNRTAKLGSFEITGVNEDFRDFTGYELSVKNPVDGGYVTEISSEYYYDVHNNKIVVRNIEFKPEQVGVYQVSIRAFDLSGASIVSIALIEVKQGPTGNNGTLSTVLPSTGSINVNYKFRDEKLDLTGLVGDYYMVHKITGSRHAVMGSEFTAKTASSYYIVDGYAKYDAGSVGELLTEVNGGGYTVSFTDEDTPVIEIQGPMPTYAEKKAKVELPSIVAFNKYANGSVKVSVRKTSGGTTDADYDEATGKYSFTPTEDGEYTIIVVGTVNNVTNTAEYKMNVGDVVGPKFALDTTHDKSATVGAKFLFKVLEITLDTDEKMSDTTVTKTLYDPSGSVVSEATISGKADSVANKTAKDSNTNITLSKSGTYIVEYVVTDKANNSTVQRYEISVSGKTKTNPFSIAAISTVLIVVGVVLIAAVILYFVLFRKRKAKN